MDTFGDGANAMIAGATGLVGTELMEQLLALPAIATVTALVRRPLGTHHEKLTQIQNADLSVPQWDEQLPKPDLGFICLGTTKKKAGSKQALAHVDVELVTQVAQTMKLLGVKRIAVVSSYGANASSGSYYLKCKGRMEQIILKMGFERVVFVRPGPLAGHRMKPRTDEIIVQKVLFVAHPFLFGPLANFQPIQASKVAKAMLFTVIKPNHHPSDSYCTLNSREIHSLLEHYQVTN